MNAASPGGSDLIFIADKNVHFDFGKRLWNLFYEFVSNHINQIVYIRREHV